MNQDQKIILFQNRQISDAAAEFGSAGVIRDTFISFQKYLYLENMGGEA